MRSYIMEGVTDSMFDCAKLLVRSHAFRGIIAVLDDSSIVLEKRQTAEYSF